MTEKLEPPSTSTPASRETRPNGLYRALAWVGIAAGSLFIVGAVFFSGYYLGQQSGDIGHRGPRAVMIKPGGPMGPGGPMMDDDGPRRVERVPLEQPSTPPSTPPRP